MNSDEQFQIQKQVYAEANNGAFDNNGVPNCAPKYRKMFQESFDDFASSSRVLRDHPECIPRFWMISVRSFNTQVECDRRVGIGLTKEDFPDDLQEWFEFFHFSSKCALAIKRASDFLCHSVENILDRVQNARKPDEISLHLRLFPLILREASREERSQEISRHIAEHHAQGLRVA